MKIFRLFVVVALTVLSGCVVVLPQPERPVTESGALTPQQAVLMAAKAAPGEVSGTFAMRVQATGSQNHRSYLNSELDYRDQQNLTVALTPSAARQLEKKIGANSLEALKGRNILVTGSAVRTKIHFVVKGQMTDKYYYQTHVNVDDAAQVVVQ